MATKTGKITRGQSRAIAALLAAPSVPKAAKAAGLAERSLYRWLTKPEFQNEYRKARREIVRHAVVRIQAAMSSAIATLMAIIGDSNAPASSRVSAARTIIDYGLKASELEDLDRRLTDLETQIKERA